MKIILAYLAITLLFISCDKKTGDVADNELPVINLGNPVNGQTFTAGQVIPIAGTITDNDRIAEVHIHVTNIATSALLMDVHLYPDAGSAPFNQSITAAAGVQYRIVVIAKDRKVNEARSTAQVSAN